MEIQKNIFEKFIQQSSKNLTAALVAPATPVFPQNSKDEFIINKPQKKISFKKKIAIAGGVSLIMAAGILAAIKFKKPIYKDDFIYKQDLLKGLGINPKNQHLLRSIMGVEELQDTVKSFTRENFVTGTRSDLLTIDSEDLSNVKSLKYRANLHIHTNHSDGKLSVQNLLDQAVEYADKVAASKPEKAPKAPFIVAITDHDSVEGAKEALNIIKDNPKKYNNLRVVLGVEISTITNELKSANDAFRTHLLAYGINPFDKTLTSGLENKTAFTIQHAKNMLSELSNCEEIKEVLQKRGIAFSYDDAKNIHTVIKYGQCEINHSIKDYATFKVVFAEHVINNPSITKLLADNGIEIKNIDFLKAKGYMQGENFSKITEKFRYEPGDNEWKRYREALKLYIQDELRKKGKEISFEEIDIKFGKTPNAVVEVLGKIMGICWDNRAYYKDGNLINPQLIEFKDAVKLINTQDHSVMGIAHPALEAVDNKSFNSNILKTLLEKFKEYGKEKAVFAEIYYPYYGSLCNHQIIKDIESMVLEPKLGLLKTGSLDTHGINIFYTDRA